MGILSLLRPQLWDRVATAPARLALLTAACIGFMLTLGCHSRVKGDRAVSSSPAVARLLDEAGQRRAAGDPAGARAALEEALRIAPDHPKALAALGRLQLLDFSDPDGALATYRRAVKVAPGDAEAHYGLGQQLHFRGEIDAARAEFQEALRLRTGWSHAAAWLGTTELEALPADVPSAIGHLEAAVAKDPRYAFARYQLGRAYGRAGRWKDAAASLQAAVELKPGYREAHYALGQALLRLSQPEAARQALARFQALDVARRERRSRNVRRRAGADEAMP
jgi:tetratricopeptide (TPR) repeat protein